MRAELAFVLGMAPAALLASDGPNLSSVPAAMGAAVSKQWTPPDLLSVGVVRIVGVAGGSMSRSDAPTRVFSVEISALRVADSPAGTPAGRAMPANARWPDAHDRIEIGPADDPARRASAEARNPWEIRVRQKGATTETVFMCGGIIEAGNGGAVAILNGKVARRGDTALGFSVADVVAAGVVLERNGAFFVIPRGRRTTLDEAER